jgi:hypothetical protein
VSLTLARETTTEVLDKLETLLLVDESKRIPTT